MIQTLGEQFRISFTFNTFISFLLFSDIKSYYSAFQLLSQFASEIFRCMYAVRATFAHTELIVCLHFQLLFFSLRPYDEDSFGISFIRIM